LGFTSSFVPISGEDEVGTMVRPAVVLDASEVGERAETAMAANWCSIGQRSRGGAASGDGRELVQLHGGHAPRHGIFPCALYLRSAQASEATQPYPVLSFNSCAAMDPSRPASQPIRNKQMQAHGSVFVRVNMSCRICQIHPAMVACQLTRSALFIQCAGSLYICSACVYSAL
jgi:hypothetical protein